MLMQSMPLIVTGCIAVVLAVASPITKGDEAAIDNGTEVLPPDFKGDSIASLMDKSRHAPRSEFETDEAYLTRLGLPEDEPLRLVDAAGCHPIPKYDTERKEWTIHLVSLAGMFALSCEEGLQGVMPAAGDLQNILKIPMRAEDAQKLSAETRLWLAFTRTVSLEHGRVRSLNTAEALVVTDLALWITDREGKVVLKKGLSEVKPEPFVETNSETIKDSVQVETSLISVDQVKPFNWVAACNSPDRVALLSSRYDEIALIDIRLQLQGLQANGDEIGTTFEQYLAKRIASACEGGGIPVHIDLMAHTFKIPGKREPKGSSIIITLYPNSRHRVMSSGLLRHILFIKSPFRICGKLRCLADK